MRPKDFLAERFVGLSADSGGRVERTIGSGWIGAARKRATLLLFASAFAVVALLIVFAVELSNTQANSKTAIKARVHERAVLAGALVDSLFSTVTQQVPADVRAFGGRTVKATALNKDVGSSAYLVILGPNGAVLASSSGFTKQDSSSVSNSGAVRLVERGDSYGLGNLVRRDTSNEIEFAVGLPTAYGRRILVEGATASTLTAFFAGELKRIPGVAGSHNLIVDKNDTVIASNVADPAAGYQIVGAARVALGSASGDRAGRYYDQVPLADSTWRIIISSPNAGLFASVSGWNWWVPWLVFIAFAFMALIAFVLGWRVVHSAERNLASANSQLAAVNQELAASNRELKRQAAELARSNADLDQFASIASHDLQEPLRKVRTFTEQVATTESDRISERGADYLARANRAAERMQGLIQDLLQFSRVTTNPRPFVRVDLNTVAAEALDDLSLEIEGTDAVVSIGELPTIHADPLQMRQLTLNLISNAIKFRREGVPPEVEISAEVLDGSVQITVADNGIGFEPQYSTRIFRVFERLHGRTEYPGTGIGLALCHKIVGRHGGRIVAESQLGEGATFTVTLPIEQIIDENELILDDQSEPVAKEQTSVLR
jgi:signal transduction histidine kinase